MVKRQIQRLTALVTIAALYSIGCARGVDLKYYNTSTTASSSPSPTPSPSVSVAPLAISASTNRIALSGSLKIAVTGGVTPYNYAVTSPATGGGTIDQAGNYMGPAAATLVIVTVTDAAKSTVQYGFSVESIALSPATATVIAGGTVALTPSNGIGTYTYAITSPATGGGTVSAQGLYTAPASVAQTIAVTVTVTDAQGATSSSVITVNPKPSILSCAGTYSAVFSSTPTVYTIVVTQAVANGPISGTFAGAGVIYGITGTCSGGQMVINLTGLNVSYPANYAASGNVVQLTNGTIVSNGAVLAGYSWTGTSTTAPVYY